MRAAHLPRLGALRFAAAFGLLAAALQGAVGAPLSYQVYNSPKRIASVVLEDPHYHHAATVAQYGSRVYVAWNGNDYNASEGQPGQVIMLRTSDDDGATWSKTTIPFSKAYRALDDQLKKGVDAAPGDADDNHKVHNPAARQWQPALTVFKGKLLMFWGMDRDAEGSAMMMSVLEPDGRQWRSNELHFKGDGSPYFVPEIDGQAGKSDDPSSLSIPGRYPKILGADTIPTAIRLNDIPPALLKAENAAGPQISLQGQRLVPSSNQAAVLRLKDGTEVLAVSAILEQTSVDWNNLAVKIPAVLTTTDLQTWQMSVVPLKPGGADLLGHARGDLGLVSAWEPTVNVDHLGNFHMEFRLNLPPRTAGGGDPDSNGTRSAGVIGSFEPGVGVHWKEAHRADFDLAVSRSTITKLPGDLRWVMAGNNNVQGASYDGRGIPVFRAEKFEPWARENLTLFFSTRGDDDFVAGLNVSGDLDAHGVEEVHYPYIQSAAIGGKGDDLLVVFSTHRREPSCKGGNPNPRACHDSIRFVRIKELPDPKAPAIYPNHFARYFSYGRPRPQDKVYSLKENLLTLVDRGSAGIETAGNDGCMNLRFRLDGAVADGDVRPIVSFGRTSDRVGAIGLVVRGGRLFLGEKPIGNPVAPGAWNDVRVCYDYAAGRLSAGGVDWTLGPGNLSQRTYLGDQTLAKRDRRLPDLSFDLAGTSLELGNARAPNR